MITNNLNVARILGANPSTEVIVTGGVVRAKDQGIVGEAAVDFIRQFKVDIAVIGISGIEQTAPCATTTTARSKSRKPSSNHAREVWVAADASKFNRPAMVEVGHLSQIDRLYTDALPPAPFPSLLSDAQVQLKLAR